MIEDILKLRSGRPTRTSICVEDFLCSQYHYIPTLIAEIQNKTGASVEDVKIAIWNFCKKNENDGVYLQKTREILQTGRTRGGRVEKRRLRLILKSKNGFLFSHILLTEPFGRFKG